VSNKLGNIHKVAKIFKQISSYDNTISKPFFKMDCIHKRNEESYLKTSSSVNNQLLIVISKQIKELDAITKGKNIACLGKTCQNNISDFS